MIVRGAPALAVAAALALAVEAAARVGEWGDDAAAAAAALRERAAYLETRCVCV
jgi:methylthioribose-1-phosphate isomerase